MSRAGGWRTALLSMAIVFAALIRVEALSAQAVGSIVGTVRAESGQVVAGAQVFLPELDQGTLTDARGQFLMPGIPAGTYTLEVRHISYNTANDQVTVQSGQAATVEFALTSSVLALDEVVVTGVGVVTEKRRLGQSVASLSAEEFATAPVTSVSEVLAGRIPGLVAHSLGETGASAPIRLRGTVSLSQSNDPLIYVDGVRVDNERMGFASVVVSPLDHINPQNIARIEVLKGAAAATLYGTEASAGVIQIYTKQGRAGAPQWDFSTTQQMARMHKDRIPANVAYDAASGDILRNFPADDFLRMGYHQSYTLSVRGGTEAIRYFGSGWWKDETGTLPTNALSNMGVRLGLDFDLSERLTTAVNFNLIKNEIRAPYPTWGLMGEFTLADPRIADDTRPYGELFYTVQGALAFQNVTAVDRYTISAQANYTWTEDLSSHLTVGYHGAHEVGTIFTEFGEGLRDPTGARERDLGNHENITLDFSTALDLQITDDLASTLTVGGQSFWENQRVTSAGVTDYPAPGLRTLRGGSTVTDVDEFYEEVINAGLFAQEQIGLADRLFVTAGVRVDGNSAFGEDFGFQAYPKVGASWNVSDEGFWNVDAINLFRLRSAYGTSGLQPGAYDALRTWRAESRVNNNSVLQPQSVGNSELRPERSTEVELGADIGVFSNRLGLELTYFWQNTTDGILERYLPPSVGFLEPQFVNIGRLESQGLEAALNVTLAQSTGLNWSAYASMSTLDQMIVDLGDVPDFKVSSDTRRWNWIREGYSPGAVVAPVLDPADPYHLVGAGGESLTIDEFTELEQLVPHTLQAASGQDSLVFIGNQLPTFTGTVGSTLELPQNNLSLRMMWRAETGFVMFDETNLIRATVGITEDYAQMTRDLQDPTTSSARREEIAQQWAHSHPLVHSTWVQDADFIRLQELALTWDLPESMRAPLGLGATSLTLFGRNLLLFTKYDGMIDPGASSTSDNDFALNVDYYGAPSAARWGLTLQTSF